MESVGKVERDLYWVVRYFFERYRLRGEVFRRVGTLQGHLGPICEMIDVMRPTVFGMEHASFFVSKKVDWFHSYGRDYGDARYVTGMMLRYDIAKAAHAARRSVLAIYVESDGSMYAMSGSKFYNYVRAFTRVKKSPYEADVIDAACPRVFWKLLNARNKFDIV